MCVAVPYAKATVAFLRESTIRGPAWRVRRSCRSPSVTAEDVANMKVCGGINKVLYRGTGSSGASEMYRCES